MQGGGVTDQGDSGDGEAVRELGPLALLLVKPVLQNLHMLLSILKLLSALIQLCLALQAGIYPGLSIALALCQFLLHLLQLHAQLLGVTAAITAASWCLLERRALAV